MHTNKLIQTTKVLVWCTALGAAALAAGAASAQTKPYYQGKTINIIVGFAPGGGSDLGARAIAEYLGKHIEGHPTVIVRNMTGAGGITAANYTYEKAPKDGTTLLFGAWYLLSEGMDMQGMRVKYDELTLVAPTRSPGSYVTYMRKDAVPGGYKEPKDILKAQKLRVAGVALTSNVDQRLQLSFKALGTDIVHVTGLPGLARAAQAVRTGEMQASGVALAGYMQSVKPNMVEDGTVVPLFFWALEDAQGKPIPNKYAPDIPSFYDFYVAVKGVPPSGKYWEALRIVNDISELATHIFFGPPGMEKAAIEPLRKGVIDTLNDPQYIAQAEKISTYAHIYVPVEEAQALVDRVKKVSPDVLNVMKEITQVK